MKEGATEFIRKLRRVMWIAMLLWTIGLGGFWISIKGEGAFGILLLIWGVPIAVVGLILYLMPGGKKKGTTPVQNQPENPKVEWRGTSYLSERKVEIDESMTPMMYAAKDSKDSIWIISLLKEGADINARNKDGKTPLMFAARDNPNPEIIKALLAAGADGKVKDSSGKTALDYAQDNEKLKGTDAYWKLKETR